LKLKFLKLNLIFILLLTFKIYLKINLIIKLTNKFSWELNKPILLAIINDRLSDRFVCELIWERLFYKKDKNSEGWIFSQKTPSYWSDIYNEGPQIISERKASVHLARSINKLNKNIIKEFLNFKGYKINELYPRRNRRVTAVNWLISWAKDSDRVIFEKGEMPILSIPPINPNLGHINDLPIS
tara:strand:+ start:1920 stop:2471 length:552 start_codon:yes stop_codon:yes gene_type:complete